MQGNQLYEHLLNLHNIYGSHDPIFWCGILIFFFFTKYIYSRIHIYVSFLFSVTVSSLILPNQCRPSSQNEWYNVNAWECTLPFTGHLGTCAVSSTKNGWQGINLLEMLIKESSRTVWGIGLSWSVPPSRWEHLFSFSRGKIGAYWEAPLKKKKKRSCELFSILEWVKCFLRWGLYHSKIIVLQSENLLKKICYKNWEIL